MNFVSKIHYTRFVFCKYVSITIVVILALQYDETELRWTRNSISDHESFQRTTVVFVKNLVVDICVG